MPVRQLDAAPLQSDTIDKGYLIGDMPLDGGLNNKHSPRWVKENQAVFLREVSLRDVTRPERRHGYTEIVIADTGIEAGLQAKRIGGLGFMDPAEGSRSLVINIPDSGAGATYYTHSPTSGGWHKAFESDGTTSFDPGTDNVISFMANDRLWMIGGQATPITVFDNTALLTPAGVASTDAPFAANAGVYILNRVWLLANTKLYWSSLLPTTPIGTFDQVVDTLTMSPNRGSRGVAIKAWKDSSLIVFFSDSIEELIINSVDPSNSVRNVIEPNYGCGSRDSIVVVGEDMYFIDQYGHYRSLRRTAQGIMAGVVPKPLSDIIRGILPDRLNLQVIDKVKAHLEEDRLQIYLPIDLTLEASARVTWDFSQNLWTGPDVLGDRLGHIVSSDIRGRGNETYYSNGSTSTLDAAVYRWDKDLFDDDGSTISFKLETRALTFDVPEAMKGFEWFELEYHGDVGVAPTVGYRLDEVGDFTVLTVDNGDTSLAAGTGTDFPITSFPITSFPLLFVAPGVARARYHLNALAIADARTIEFQIREQTAGLQFQIIAWRLIARPKFVQREVVTD